MHTFPVTGVGLPKVFRRAPAQRFTRLNRQEPPTFCAFHGRADDFRLISMSTIVTGGVEKVPDVVRNRDADSGGKYFRPPAGR